jgi:hypothetical protein
VLSRTSASAGLAAIAATAGTLFMTSPASAQTTAAPAHVSAVAAQTSASAPYGDGWWWRHRHFRHHRHHFFRHHPYYFRHHYGGYYGAGFRPFGGFGGNVNRNVNVVSNDIGISNNNTNVAISRGW